jgi:hypothetical protein
LYIFFFASLFIKFTDMKRQALVVGINRYPFLKFSPTSEANHLTTPAYDAEAVAWLLERYGQFEVKRLPGMPDVSQLNPTGTITAAELKEAITELFSPQGNSNVGLLYFAGHGWRQKYDDGSTEGFLVTSDANIRTKYGVSLKWLREILHKSPVQQQIVWLDCSFSGELFNFTENEIINQKIDRCFITATEASEVAYTIEGRGVLTKALLSSLNPNNYDDDKKATSITIRDIIEEQVKHEVVKQKPVFYITGYPIILTTINPAEINRNRRNRLPNEHRLESLWRETADWFAIKDQDLLMKHTYYHIHEYFFGNPPNPEKTKAYREGIEEVLEVNFPSDWWENTKAIENLHKSLKCLCGAVFCGESESGDRPITIGSAYLIALMAYAEIFGDAKDLTKTIDLSQFEQLDAQLFPIQEPEIARLSAKALYDLFFCLFEACRNGESQFQQISFNEQGYKFTIEFTRGADEAEKEGELSLAEELPQILNNDNVPTPKLTNTKSAILRLWRYMLISKFGFMSPGVIYMEREKLVIASSKGRQ